MAMGIRSIQFIADSLPVKARIQLVHALVLSHMNYASVLYNDIKFSNKVKLDTQLKWAVRVCFGIAPRETCSKFQTDARILNAENQRQYFTLCKFFPIVYQTSKAFPNNSFPNFTSEMNNRTQKIRCLKYNKNIYKNSFLRTATNYWNNLPQALTDNTAEYKSFQYTLKNYLLEKQRMELGLTMSTRNTWRGFKITFDNG